MISGFEILEGDHPFLHCVVLCIAYVPAVVFPNTSGILDEDLASWYSERLKRRCRDTEDL